MKLLSCFHAISPSQHQNSSPAHRKKLHAMPSVMPGSLSSFRGWEHQQHLMRMQLLLPYAVKIIIIKKGLSCTNERLQLTIIGLLLVFAGGQIKRPLTLSCVVCVCVYILLLGRSTVIKYPPCFGGNSLQHWSLVSFFNPNGKWTSVHNPLLPRRSSTRFTGFKNHPGGECEVSYYCAILELSPPGQGNQSEVSSYGLDKQGAHTLEVDLRLPGDRPNQTSTA